MNNVSAFTESQAFYVEGSASDNHVPFKAKPSNPYDGSKINGDQVVLKWETSDVDNDPMRYELFFGKEKILH